MNKSDRMKKIKRMHSKIRWDIVDMGVRLADELFDNMFHTNEAEHSEYYMIGRRAFDKAARWQGEDGKAVLFGKGILFETKGDARRYAADHDLSYTAIHKIDLVLAEITTDFTYQICEANDCYIQGKMCPICKKNAAVKVTNKRDGEATGGGTSYMPCRACSIGDGDELDVVDQLGSNSMLACAQEFERVPSFTKKELEDVSRAAAKRRIWPSFGPEAI